MKWAPVGAEKWTSRKVLMGFRCIWHTDNTVDSCHVFPQGMLTFPEICSRWPHCILSLLIAHCVVLLLIVLIVSREINNLEMMSTWCFKVHSLNQAKEDMSVSIHPKMSLTRFQWGAPAFPWDTGINIWEKEGTGRSPAWQESAVWVGTGCCFQKMQLSAT